MTWMRRPRQASKVATASSRRGLAPSSSGAKTRASTAVGIFVSTSGPLAASHDRLVGLDELGHAALPRRQRGELREQRVLELPLYGPGGLLGARVLVHPHRPAQLGELGEPGGAAH